MVNWLKLQRLGVLLVASRFSLLALQVTLISGLFLAPIDAAAALIHGTLHLLFIFINELPGVQLVFPSESIIEHLLAHASVMILKFH